MPDVFAKNKPQNSTMDELTRKIYGAYETPTWIFSKIILPHIKDVLWDYLWVDLYCGSGNLILPMLELIPESDRVVFFEEHVFLCDILPEMVQRARYRASNYGIPPDLASKRIVVRNTFEQYPIDIFKKSNTKIFHITNPPYLYIGYIVKNKQARFWLRYFAGLFRGLQDLYQLALAYDVVYDIDNLIYIIPTNFLYGSSGANKIRCLVFEKYLLKKVYIFEKQIFDYTGQHVGVFFFVRKKHPSHHPQTFEVLTFSDGSFRRKTISVLPENKYRASTIFDEFVKKYKANLPLRVRYYLFEAELIKNKGKNKIIVIDSNKYIHGKYQKRIFYVNDKIYRKIKNNILFVKTVDGIKEDDRAGLYVIRDFFDADAIVVSRAPYRTHPIHLFLEPEIKPEQQILLMKYFNLLLNYFRRKTGGEFLTTYKYVDKDIVRKYLGLTQVRSLIETFPILCLDEKEKEIFKKLIDLGDAEKVIEFIKKIKKKNKTLLTWIN